MNITLFQLNLWMGRLFRQAITVIGREQPDIVCVQEAFSAPVDVPLPNMTFNNVEQIADRLGYNHVFFAPTHMFHVESVPVRYGNAIICKYPLLDQQIVQTYGEYVPSATAMNYQNNSRNAQLARIQLPGGISHIIGNHHGYVLPSTVGDTTTVACMQKFADTFVQYRHDDEPAVLCGDFNVAANSTAMRVWDGLLIDITRQQGITQTLSTLSKQKEPGFIGDPNTPIACDHILVNKQVECVSLRRLDDLISDHYAQSFEYKILPKHASKLNLTAANLANIPA